VKFNAKFVSSYPKVSLLPDDGLPEVAFIGRSNVGKSSLINALTEKKQLAKTSSTPGKTQLLNYFIVNDQFYLVDMPGFGYAKVGKEDRRQWAKVSEEYFKSRKQLVAVALLIDARHPLLANDIAVVEWFSEKNIPFFIVLTKSDKPKQIELSKHEKLLKQQVFTALGVFRTSSEKGTGINQLRAFIADLLSGKSEQNPQLHGK
jgi:GTP-binding protein